MSKYYNEKTRVQMPAMIHLLRLGWQYVGRIQHNERGGGLQYGNGIILDESTNILVNTFRDAFLRLNPDSKDKW